MTEISIIVPVYKAQKGLDRCVRSILNQTFTDFELILVDDGSPDRCPQMCDEWAKKDSRIKVFHKANGGASSARNLGLLHAGGRYVGFVDSDDWIEPNMYEELHALVVKNDVDMVISAMKSGQHTSEEKAYLWDQKKMLDHFFRLNGERNTHSICNRLIRKEAIKGFSFIEGKMNEDAHACYCFSTLCKSAVYTSTCYYHYTHNLQGVTHSAFTKKKLDLLYIWDEVARLVNHLTPEYAEAARLNKERAYFTLLAKMHIDGYNKSDAELCEIKTMLKKSVRKYFFDLIKIKMSVSRKILLILCLIF